MPTAGLLPLYAGLYDQMDPSAKNTYAPFIEELVQKFLQNNINVLKAPVCVYEKDIEDAVRSFEEWGASAVVVLFLAYHPSEVSAKALAGTGLPVIFLDTTECFDFDPGTDPELLMRCHGIHGVQDLCCVLRRRGKDYLVEAGHYRESDVVARTADHIRSCLIADRFRRSRVGLIGKPFENMGDFAMPFDELERLTGVRTVPLGREHAQVLCGAIGEDALRDQADRLRGLYTVEENLDTELMKLASVGRLVLSEWMRREKLDAFTFNFLDFNHDLGLPVIPFEAACGLMAEGYGYAGEGDVLTAALVGALMSVYPDSTFTEMFCPDWRGGTVFMSHMGEANRAVLIKPALLRKDVAYVPALNAGVMPGVSGAFKGGKAVLVNLAPGADDTFTLLLSPCEVAEPAEGDRFRDSIRGWIRPSLALEDFLKQYSLIGGTHHSCLCYDADIEVLRTFGELMGWKVAVLKSGS